MNWPNWIVVYQEHDGFTVTLPCATGDDLADTISELLDWQTGIPEYVVYSLDQDACARETRLAEFIKRETKKGGS